MSLQPTYPDNKDTNNNMVTSVFASLLAAFSIFNQTTGLIPILTLTQPFFIGTMMIGYLGVYLTITGMMQAQRSWDVKGEKILFQAENIFFRIRKYDFKKSLLECRFVSISKKSTRREPFSATETVPNPYALVHDYVKTGNAQTFEDRSIFINKIPQQEHDSVYVHLYQAALFHKNVDFARGCAQSIECSCNKASALIAIYKHTGTEEDFEAACNFIEDPNTKDRNQMCTRLCETVLFHKDVTFARNLYINNDPSLYVPILIAIYKHTGVEEDFKAACDFIKKNCKSPTSYLPAHAGLCAAALVQNNVSAARTFISQDNPFYTLNLLVAIYQHTGYEQDFHKANACITNHGDSKSLALLCQAALVRNKVDTGREIACSMLDGENHEKADALLYVYQHTGDTHDFTVVNAYIKNHAQKNDYRINWCRSELCKAALAHKNVSMALSVVQWMDDSLIKIERLLDVYEAIQAMSWQQRFMS